MVEEDSGAGKSIKKFGTFSGVFVPTLLTILGVIMFLRLGWVVGSVGLIGAWIIILLAFTITTATALSMSSITTNMRIGSGGAYSIISRSLGLEIGGSIGVPLYLSLTLSMVMYIFGFREGLQFILPAVSPLVIDFLVFGILLIIVLASTSIAFKIQYVILGIIVLSILSILLGGLATAPRLEMHQPESGISFWIVFAVFFPAATGIMAGANMSGELRKPKKAIPVGTISAIVVSLTVYLLLAYWLAGSATSTDLVGNYTILFDISLWWQLVIAGLLCATFSSALNSLVGASRILQAMAENNVVPGKSWLSRRSKSGEPRNAVMITGFIVMFALLLRDLNTVAPIITMFFLITYTMINVVILIEQSLGLVSFRPLLKIPKSVPLLGTIGCLFAMFIINPLVSLVAIFVVIGFYYVLMHRQLKSDSPYGDVRSSLFVALAEWAAKKSQTLPHSHERAWRPNLLIPVENPVELRGVSEFVRDITFPQGSVNIIGANISSRTKRVRARFSRLSKQFREEDIYSTWTVVESCGYAEDVIASMQSLKRSFFSPNTLFLRMPQSAHREDDEKRIMKKATMSRMGIILYAAHPRAGLGGRRRINLWIPDQCLDWQPSMKLPNCDLALLTAYKLKINWEGELNVIATVKDLERVSEIKEMLENLVEMTRIPVDNIIVVAKPFDSYIGLAPQGDINIFNLPPNPDFDHIRKVVQTSRSTCLFCRDSGEESALA